MKRFLILAMTILVLAAICAPVMAATAYIAEVCQSDGTQNPLFTITTYATFSPKSSAAFLSGWSGVSLPSGNAITQLVGVNTCYQCVKAAGNHGDWSFTVPAGMSGYYKAYATWPNNNEWMSALATTYTVTNAGADVTTSIIQGTDNCNTWQLLNSAGDVQLNEGVTYTIRGTAPTVTEDDNNHRTYWDSVAWVYQGSNTPSAVTATAAGDGTAVNVSWTAPTPAPASYIIERKADGGDWTQIASGVTDLTYSDTTGICDTAYYYRVKAVDAGGIVSGPSAASLPVTKCVTAPAGKATGPNPADGATVVHTDQASISWTAGSGAVKHDVYFGTAASPSTKVSSAQSTTTWTIPANTLQPNTDYYWRIDELNGAGTVTTGDVWHFKTGVSIKVVPLRSANSGSINYYSPDAGTTQLTRNWNDVTWHAAGDSVYIGVAAKEDLGFSFDGWSLNADGTSPFSTDAQLVYTVPQASVVLYASFIGPRYTVTANADPTVGGTVTATDKTWPAATLTQVEAGETIHLVATPAAGYVFAGWESDKAGTFADPYASTTDYTMSPDNTVITGYFAHASTTIAATGTRVISSNTADGSGIVDWWTTTTNIGAQTTSNNQVWARDCVKYTDWAGISSIPAQSLRKGIGKLLAYHGNWSNYSSGMVINVSAYPITTPWVYSTNDVGCNWNTTDGTARWAAVGGDFDLTNQLGTAQPFSGNPTAAPVPKTYVLKSGVDYRALLPNGIEFISDKEGVISYRKGFGKNSSLTFFYDPPSGAENVIRSWAFLGGFVQGAEGDHQPRIDTDQVQGTYNGVPVDVTTLAPKTGCSYATPTYGTKAWAVGTSPTDNVDLMSANFLNNPGLNSATYCGVYVNNPGAAIYPAYIALGADDYCKVWQNGVNRGSKTEPASAALEQAMIGPFTLGAGWNRVIIKIENGLGLYGFIARLANADRTAITGLTFSTSDDVAPTIPTVTEAGGAVSDVAQSTVSAPVFTLAGVTDDKSGVRGVKVYFGTDPAGVPAAFQDTWTVSPGTLAYGTYYLRVSTVDYALNESAPTTVFTFKYGAAGPVDPPACTELTNIKDIWTLANDDATVYGFDSVDPRTNGKTVSAVWSDGFWIEETNRYAGIKVQYAPSVYTYFDDSAKTAVQAGDVVDIYGTLALTAGNDRVFKASYVRDRTIGAGTAIKPLGITGKFIVGTKAAGSVNTPGLPTGKGIYNAGLFVKISGAVLNPDTTAKTFFLDDKTYANGTGIKVFCGSLDVPASGNKMVTGVVGIVGNNPVIYATSIL